MKSWLLAILIGWFALPVAGAAQPGSAAAGPSAEVPTQVLVLLKVSPPHFRPDGNYASGYADTAGRSARHRIAAALARSHGLRMATDWPMPTLGLDCYVMDVPAPLRPDDVASELARDPQVAWAQAMHVFRTLGHDDPLFSMQPAARQWHLAELHATTTGRGIRIAVIDSGIQPDHPDLAGQVAVDMNFVDDHAEAAELHGTAVAGIIAARADNHVGIAGIAPGARLLALRACWQASPADTLCTSLSLARALNAAIERGARIINLSLGGPPDRLVQRLIESALARAIVVVAAINRSAPNGGFPAALPGVIAAVDDARSPTAPDAIVAPGTDIPTTLPGSRWATVSGASYAAAHVSGLLALMLDLRSNSASPSGTTREPVGADLVSDASGRIDACASLARAGVACVCACGSTSAPESIARH